MNPSPVPSHSRREFLSSVGKGLGLAALTSASVAAYYLGLGLTWRYGAPANRCTRSSRS